MWPQPESGATQLVRAAIRGLENILIGNARICLNDLWESKALLWLQDANGQTPRKNPGPRFRPRPCCYARAPGSALPRPLPTVKNWMQDETLR